MELARGLARDVRPADDGHAAGAGRGVRDAGARAGSLRRPTPAPGPRLRPRDAYGRTSPSGAAMDTGDARAGGRRAPPAPRRIRATIARNRS